MGGRVLLLRAGAVLWAASVAYAFATGRLGPLSFLYMLFGLAALASTWGEGRDLRMVGYAVMLSWTLSNAWGVILSDGGPHEVKATLFTVLEILVAVTALGVTIQRLCWLMVALVCFAAFSTSANVIYAATYRPLPDQVFIHVVVTNICFALECVFAVWAGRRNYGERAGGAHKSCGPHMYRRNSQCHGAAASSTARAQD